MIRLDHLLWAAPDLDQGALTIERLTGVAPARGSRTAKDVTPSASPTHRGVPLSIDGIQGTRY